MSRNIRILMAKPGLDGHDRGIKILARAYRDAGMDVIYLGLRQTPQMIVSAAIQEDVDVIALSVLSGAHMTIFPKILELLKNEGETEILLTGGGIIPNEDMDPYFTYCLILNSKKLIQDASTNSMKGMVSKGVFENLFFLWTIWILYPSNKALGVVIQ